MTLPVVLLRDTTSLRMQHVMIYLLLWSLYFLSDTCIIWHIPGKLLQIQHTRDWVSKTSGWMDTSYRENILNTNKSRRRFLGLVEGRQRDKQEIRIPEKERAPSKGCLCSGNKFRDLDPMRKDAGSVIKPGCGSHGVMCIPCSVRSPRKAS